MGAPTSQVGHSSATTRRGDLEFYMDMWWHGGKTFAWPRRGVGAAGGFVLFSCQQQLTKR
jgi:hypothetical protein